MRPIITLRREGGCDGAASRLSTLREEIDRLDDALLELVEQRLGLALETSALKERGDGRLKLRPRREAEILNRLTAQGRLATPEIIAHLWRELLSHGLQAQTKTELALWGNLDPDSLREQVRRRFGWAAPLVWTGAPDEALDHACRNEAIAVIENSPFSGWWLRLAHDPSLVIFDTTRLAGGEIGAFLVGRVAREDVAEGQSYEVLHEQALQDRLGRGDRIEVVRTDGALRLCHLLLGLDAAPLLRQEAAR